MILMEPVADRNKTQVSVCKASDLPSILMLQSLFLVLFITVEQNKLSYNRHKPNTKQKKEVQVQREFLAKSLYFRATKHVCLGKQPKLPNDVFGRLGG